MTAQQRHHVATTSTAGLSRLGSPGQRSFELLSRSVAHALTPAHGAIFAEPVISDRGDQVDWYTELEGRILPLTALPGPARTQVQATLTRLMDDIAAHADRLAASADPNTQRLSEALANALKIPGKSSVFAVRSDDGGDLSPVIVDWASVDGAHGGISDKLLTGWTPQRTPPAAPAQSAPAQPVPAGAAGVAGAQTSTPAAVPPTRDRERWLTGLLWLLFVLLAALMLYLLVAPCGVRGLSALNFCPAQAASADPSGDMIRERGVLENRVALLKREIATNRRACRPAAPPAAAPDDRAEAAPDDELQNRLDRENAGSGEIDIGLLWNGMADLDLHVTCPGGATINYADKIAQDCGGRLDVDMNAGGLRRNDPVEHVYFEDPAPGTYRIKVIFYDAQTRGGSHPFRLRVSFGGEVEQFSGTLDRTTPEWSTSYEYAP